MSKEKQAKTKEHIYETDVIALPTLRTVHSDTPELDSQGKHRTIRTMHTEIPITVARSLVTKLIGHFKNIEDNQEEG